MARRTNEPILKKGDLVKIKRYYKAEVQKSKNGIVLDIHEGKQANLFPFYDVLTLFIAPVASCPPTSVAPVRCPKEFVVQYAY